MFRFISIISMMAFAGCASTNFGAGIGIGGHGGSGVHVGGGVGVASPVVKQKKGGPPDHAPAHGYRKKHDHDNVELIYDGELRAYAVIDFANHYFHDNTYFRLVGDYWEVAAVFNGPWTRAGDRRIPETLRHKHRKQKNPPGQSKNKGRGKGKGKNK
jgi:hypothetical protein